MKDLYDFIKSFDMHTIIVVGIAFCWLNGSITKIRNDMIEVKSDLRVIKTALVMKGIMPENLACDKEK